MLPQSVEMNDALWFPIAASCALLAMFVLVNHLGELISLYIASAAMVSNTQSMLPFATLRTG